MKIRLYVRVLIGLVALVPVGCKIIGDDDAAADQAVAEERVDVNALPINVSAAVRGNMPAATIVAAEKQTRRGKTVHVLRLKEGETHYEMIVAPDGRILGTREIRQAPG
jgi:hypothetical protein